MYSAVIAVGKQGAELIRYDCTFSVSVSGQLWRRYLREFLHGKRRTGISGTSSGEEAFAGQDIDDEVGGVP